MFNSPIEEIKSRLDIVEVIGSYIKLNKAGANYKALCPFHSEKTPSFFVSPARQIWHCFGCSRGGDIFKFIMEIEGVEFGDALRILAKRAGVELKPRSPEWQKTKTERKRLYEVCELAAMFFEKQLAGSPKGKEAKEYLLKRGFSEESIKNWRIGWAPDVWRGLSDFLLSKGYKKEEIIRSGLAIEKDDGFYDRFRGRIIFPVFDLNSEVISFGGRIFRPGLPGSGSPEAKYINTPNTVLYNKSRVLYGLDRARVEIRKRDFSILMEGYTDVILAHQAGFTNTISVSGTALTPYHLAILKRYSDNLYLSFDMDIAGNSATKRGIDLAQMKGFNLRVIVLPEGKDPADVISGDPKVFQKSVDGALSILDFYFQNAFRQFDSKTPEGKKKISAILLPSIKRIPNKIEQSSWISQLAKKLEVREEDVEEEIKKIGLEEEPFREDSEEKIKPRQKSRKELLEERLIILLLKKPENIEMASHALDEDLMSSFSPMIKEIIAALAKGMPPKGLSEESERIFNELALRSDIEDLEEEKIEEEISYCLKEIRGMGVRARLAEVSKKIKKAEEEKDPDEIKRFTEEFNKLSKEIP